MARATVAKILKNAGVPPVPERPSTWRTFLKAQWPAVMAADLFTTEVWTARGLITYYTLFVIELASPGSRPRIHRASATSCSVATHLHDHWGRSRRRERIGGS